MDGNMYATVVVGCLFVGLFLLLLGCIDLFLLMIDCVFDLGFEDFLYDVGMYILYGILLTTIVASCDGLVALLNLMYCHWICA